MRSPPQGASNGSLCIFLHLRPFVVAPMCIFLHLRPTVVPPKVSHGQVS